MSRRLFYIAFGAAAGVLVVRRATTAAQRYTPAGVQERATRSVSDLVEQLRAFLAEVREVAAVREQELREDLGLDGRHDLVDVDQPSAAVTSQEGPR